MKFDTITLVSNDSVPFEVDTCIAFQSDLIKTMCDDVNQAESVIPLPNVNSNVLAQIIDYCSTPAKQEFISQIESLELMELILAANYLDLKSLLEAGTSEIANRISGKSTHQIREMLQLENDFTKEEEAAILKSNSWALDS